jgi:hypothetical protein
MTFLSRRNSLAGGRLVVLITLIDTSKNTEATKDEPQFPAVVISQGGHKLSFHSVFDLVRLLSSKTLWIS